MLNELPKNKGKIILYFIFLLGLLLFYPFAQLPIYAVQKNKINYIALGDSLTAGLGSSEVNYLRLHAFVPKLTSYLRKNAEVHVENHGIPGLTSAQLLWYLQQGPAMDTTLQKATIITITIGGNDLLQLLREEKISTEHIYKTVNQVAQELEKTISTIRSHNAEVPIYIMDLYSPYDPGHPLYELGELAATAYNQKLEEITTKEDQIHLVSVYPLFLLQGSRLTHILQDDIHPNDQGYELIFEAFKKKLEENR